jgi:hypothetical protein
MNPVLTFSPESFAELVEQAAELAAAKVREDLQPKWLNASDGAAYLGISRKGLENARRRGEIRGHQRDGSGYIYSRADLDAWAEAG